MGTTSQKLEYLGETKTQLKNTINLTGANLTNDTFRSYPSKLYKKLLDAVVDSDTLFNNLPKVNGTGTDITLNNTDECKIKFNMLGGNTIQNGTPTPDNPQEIRNVVGVENYFNPTIEWINNNVSCQIENQEITFTGTSYGGATNPTAISNIPAGDYIITLEVLEGTHTNNKKVWIDFFNGTTKITNMSFTSSEISKTITFNSMIDNIKVGYENGDTFTNYRFRIMIEKGSVAHEYVPYGLWASVNIHSKNLINSIEYNRSANSAGVITDNDARYLGINDYVKVKPNTAYTITFQHDISGKTMWISTKDRNGTFIERTSIGSTRTFTTGNNVYYVYIYIFDGDSGFTTVDGYTQLEENNQATTYQEYQTPQTKYIDLNIYDNSGNVIGHNELCKIDDYRDYFRKNTEKNLLKNILVNQTISNVSFVNNEGGIVSTSGTASADIYKTINEVTLKPGTYTLSGCPSGGSNNNYKLLIYNATTSTGIGSDYGEGFTFTAVEGNLYRIQIVIYNGQNTNGLLFKLQLELGSIKTDYEPYGKGWYLHKEIGKVALDGSEENLTYNSTYNRLQMPFNLQTQDWSALALTLCDHFKSGDTETVDGSFNITRTALFFKNNNLTSLNDWKTWLESNNTSVYYVLLAPTDTPITNQSVIDSLESIVKSYEDETHIVSVDDAPMYLDVSAVSKYSVGE